MKLKQFALLNWSWAWIEFKSKKRVGVIWMRVEQVVCPKYGKIISLFYWCIILFQCELLVSHHLSTLSEYSGQDRIFCDMCFIFVLSWILAFLCLYLSIPSRHWIDGLKSINSKALLNSSFHTPNHQFFILFQP